jgi:hypothetical protein
MFPKKPTALHGLTLPDTFREFCHSLAIVTAKQALDGVALLLSRSESPAQVPFSHEELIAIRATLENSLPPNEALAGLPSDFIQPPPGVPLPVPDSAHRKPDSSEED